LNAYDRGIRRVRFETSGSLFAIVQFMFAQDIKSRWQSTKGIKKPIFISRITLLSTIFQDIAPELIIKTFVLNNGNKRQNDLASSNQGRFTVPKIFGTARIKMVRVPKKVVRLG